MIANVSGRCRRWCSHHWNPLGDGCCSAGNRHLKDMTMKDAFVVTADHRRDVLCCPLRPLRFNLHGERPPDRGNRGGLVRQLDVGYDVRAWAPRLLPVVRKRDVARDESRERASGAFELLQRMYSAGNKGRNELNAKNGPHAVKLLLLPGQHPLAARRPPICGAARLRRHRVGRI